MPTSREADAGASSSRVSHRPTRPTQHAETPTERYRRQLHELRAAGGFLEHEFPRQNIWLIAQRHFEEERTGRDFFREVKRTFGQQQMRDGYPRWHFEVLEPACSVHSNIVGPLTLTRAEQLLEYKFEGVAYGQFIEVRQILPSAGGMRGLIGYGPKNPGYLGKQLGGKHVLGEGGGDKIRFSDAYREELVDRGLIQARQRIYASRSLSPRKTEKRAPAAAAASSVAMPVVTPPQQIEMQFTFAFDAPAIDIRSQIEATRIERGLSQRQLAAVLGMKQPHYSNAVVRRHDPLGAFARRRALEWLRAAA